MTCRKLLGLSATALLVAGSAVAQTTQPPAATRPPAAAMDREAPAGAAVPSSFGGVKAGDLIGKDVYNGNGDRIGEIDDIILNRSSKATAAVVGVGGFLGVGERKVALPMNQLAMKGDRVVAATSMTKDDLERMAEYQERQDDQWERFDRNRTFDDMR